MTVLKVLYVEDEPDIRSIVTMSLRALGGFEVKECSSGYEALDNVTEFSPDLVLLDVMMPGINGTETFKRLRAMPQGEKIPVIFMTAKVQSREVQDYMNLGAIGVIVKPFDPLTLSQQISELLKKPQG